MIEPFSAATLGGLAYDTARAAISKWVSGRIAAGVDTALRDRQVKQGRPAKDQQTELAAVIRTAVEQTAAELFPGQERLQRGFQKALLQGKQQDWPLVNGTDLTDLVSDIHTWLTQNDPLPGSQEDTSGTAEHPYLTGLCRNIIAQFGFRAENNGTKNTILYPRWHRFWTNELLANRIVPSVSGPASVEFHNEFGGGVGNVFQGRQVIVNTAPAPPVRIWPSRFGSIPPRATSRQDRSVDAELTKMLADSIKNVACQILSGMGGVGKTQIAASYALDRWNTGEVDLLLWVTAASRDAIITAFAHVGAEICGADPANNDRAAQSFLTSLDRPDAPRWLIILDDLTDPADLTGLWPPISERGHAIVTTRRRDAALEGHGRVRIDVGPYTPAESIAYLTERLHREPRLIVGAAELAADLGHLPLALAQAAAYIIDQPGLTCRDYRNLLADQGLTLNRLEPDALPDDYPRSIAATLALSIERAHHRQFPRTAKALLNLASMLAPNGIPAALFTSEVTREFLSASVAGPGNAGPETVIAEHDIATVLGRLRRLSLIDYDGDNVHVHALVQRVCRESLDKESIDTVALVSADALAEIWPEPETDPAFSAVLRTHAERLNSLAPAALLRSDAHPVLYFRGRSLGATGQVGDAAAYFARLHLQCEEALGRNHNSTLTARHDLAYWVGSAGDPARAATDLEALLADCIRSVGTEDPISLAVRNNLVALRAVAGDVDGVVAALQEILDERIRILGLDHPATLTARNNLAYWRGKTGDSLGAVAEYEDLVPELQRVLGPEHPHTLAGRGNLARWRGESGDPAAAVAAFEEILTDQDRVLGSDHPYTLATRGKLAGWKGAAGDPLTAAKALRKLLTDQERVLGPDHPDTLITRGDLARWRGESGNPRGAVTAYKRLIPDLLRVLGSDHPDTFAARHQLIRWLNEIDDAQGLTAAYEELLVECRRMHGPDHPDTLGVRNNLAFSRGAAGDPATAATEFRDLLQDLRSVFEPTHPLSVAARDSLALWTGEAGNPQAAVGILDELLADLTRAFGPDHRDAVRTRYNLELWRLQADIRSGPGPTDRRSH